MKTSVAHDPSSAIRHLPSGRIVQRVVLPARTRLVGFGANGAIYLVRINEDDQEFLERYRLN